MENRDYRSFNMGSYWWLFLLLLPVAFYFGWVAAASNYSNSGTPGVGGGPGTINSVTTTPTDTPTPASAIFPGLGTATPGPSETITP